VEWYYYFRMVHCLMPDPKPGWDFFRWHCLQELLHVLPEVSGVCLHDDTAASRLQRARLGHDVPATGPHDLVFPDASVQAFLAAEACVAVRASSHIASEEGSGFLQNIAYGLLDAARIPCNPQPTSAAAAGIVAADSVTLQLQHLQDADRGVIRLDFPPHSNASQNTAYPLRAQCARQPLPVPCTSQVFLDLHEHILHVVRAGERPTQSAVQAWAGCVRQRANMPPAPVAWSTDACTDVRWTLHGARLHAMDRMTPTSRVSLAVRWSTRLTAFPGGTTEDLVHFIRSADGNAAWLDSMHFGPLLHWAQVRDAGPTGATHDVRQFVLVSHTMIVLVDVQWRVVRNVHWWEGFP
jgi:hypothetical protein